MQRRTLLQAVGASAIGGATLAGTTAAQSADSQLLEFDYEIDTADVSGGDSYTVTYTDEGTAEISGSISLSVPCYDVEVAGIESTRFGDVVRIVTTRQDGACTEVVAEATYEAVVDAPDDVFVEHVDGDSIRGGSSFSSLFSFLFG